MIDEVFRKAQTSRIVVGKKSVDVNADDLVIVANEKNYMKEMMKNVERYMKKKRLEVNINKSKMMVFRTGRGRAKTYKWR